MNNYYEKVKVVLQSICKGRKPMALVRTYGCQQNVSDGEMLKGMLILMGYDITDDPKLADFIIFNTCAIREHAENRVFGNVGALKTLKRSKPDMIIGLCGCMPEQEHVRERIKNSFPFVNLVFGTHSLSKFPELVFRALTDGKRVFATDTDESIHEGIPISRDNKIKAFVPIMYGCDNFCSYCIVSYVRGRERSRKSKDILSEIKDLVKNGYKEITLLGQNVNSYGNHLEENINFSQLLREIDKIEGDYWIRFMTSHPKDATKELIDTIASSEHICKQLHLPVQSGNNRVLKAMNRRYTVENYLDIIDYAKLKMPKLSITSDIIVGFPGETYNEFQDTLELIKEVGYSSLFTFIYSRRKGTKAADFEDPISYEEKTEWFSELLNVQEKESEKYSLSLKDTVQKVLIEDKSSKDGIITGRNTGNIITEIEDSDKYIGTFQNVKITDSKTWILEGKII